MQAGMEGVPRAHLLLGLHAWQVEVDTQQVLLGESAQRLRETNCYETLQAKPSFVIVFS
jgi:hypothetical protein